MRTCSYSRGLAMVLLVVVPLCSPVRAFADVADDGAAAQQSPSPAATRIQSLRRLNTPNRFAMPVRTVDALRRAMSGPAMRRDIVRVLDGAGLGSLQADVLRILSDGLVTESTLPPAR